MAMNLVGVDIGSTSLRAVELDAADKAKPTLLRLHEIHLPEGAVIRGEVTEPEIVASALRRLWSEGGFKSKHVVLGIGNHRVLVRDLSVPKMSLKRIRESLPFQIQNLLQVPIADSLLDFYPISESPGDHSQMVNGLLIAAEKEAILGNIHVVEQAGLSPVEVDLIPFALSRLLIGRPHLAGTVALIDAGASTTSVTVAIDGVPQFVRIIPAGGDDLTQALKTELEIEANQAEWLKRTLNLPAKMSTAEDPRVREILYSITSELLSSLRNTISYFSNTRPQDPVTQIVLTGGGSQLVGFAESLAEMTHLPVTAADPFTSLAPPRRSKAKKLHYSRRSITVALGLALRNIA